MYIIQVGRNGLNNSCWWSTECEEETEHAAHEAFKDFAGSYRRVRMLECRILHQKGTDNDTPT